MKKLIICISFAILLLNATSQNKSTDLPKGIIHFELKGLIEIDGHIFKNDTCSTPIICTSDLKTISIVNSVTKQTYSVRKCKVANCEIIHLNQETENSIPEIQFFNDRLDSLFILWK